MVQQYDVFIAGIQPEYKDDADRIIKEFSSLFPDHQSLSKALDAGAPGEYCLARKVSRRQAEDNQRQLARLGLICRYRPAINQNPAFSLEPLPAKTLTCPFCQHTQPKPEKLQGKRCENCNAKMTLFEKRREILEKLQKPESSIRPLAENPLITDAPVAKIIRRAEQQHRRKQQWFSYGLLGFTLTAIIAITTVAVYQTLDPDEPEPPKTVVVTPSKPKPASSTASVNPKPLHQQEVNSKVLSELSADNVLALAKNLENTADKIDTLPDIADLMKKDSKSLKPLLASENPLTPEDTDKLIAAIGQSIKSLPEGDSMEHLVEQARKALPFIAKDKAAPTKTGFGTLWRSYPGEKVPDIFAPLYAMEAYNLSQRKSIQNQHPLLQQYQLQKKFLQQYRQIQDKASRRFEIHKPAKTAKSRLDKSIIQWLYPETADILLSNRFNPLTPPSKQ